MNNIGFISPTIASLPYELYVCDQPLWDRQTVILWCDNNVDINQLRRHLRNIHKPQATSHGSHYEIDIFVNLNYSRNERDPANRSVRIIYCRCRDLTMESINHRFPNSYIIRVEERSELNGSSRISREVPQISG